MVEPPLFFDVLGIAAAFPLMDDIVVFSEAEPGDLPSCFVEFGGPAENWLGECGDIDCVFGEDEGDEKGLLVDDHRSSPAEALKDGDFVPFHPRKVEQCGRVSRNPHDDRAGRANIDDAKISRVCAKKSLF